MTRLLHLTDLHFGLHRPELVQPLHDAVLLNRPDVVVVSGDLTQRALAGQFRAAMAFLRGLGVPFMAIPGNHDLPVFNPLARLLNPFGAYRRGAARDLTPVLSIGRLRLFGVNTADPLQWRGGVARMDEVDWVCRAMLEGPTDVTNILVCHHPFEEPAGFERGETANAQAATQKLIDAGLHAILSGHLHHWTIGLGISKQGARPLFQIQTGTALCSRFGERDHGFSVMDFDGSELSVTPWVVDEPTGRFAPQPSSAFLCRDRMWYKSA
ncbi:metallophosphoesterase [Cypionkella sp.]|uniref:metallophosphoesterase family protein n=1 Tax=Cypionkella sp. TaxID=2811411 RepID=UPI002AB9008B|nr:metallophosphoesterase [Cypionkella sp.]MDZ4395038.1 metallophosphoesterase [Cypionkella sp.]